MAMPTSGSIGLKFCQALACSSICVAVGYVGTASLSAMSVSAGKTAPHTMREFEGYVSSSPVNLSSTYSTATECCSIVCGVNGAATTLCVCMRLGADAGGKATARGCIICNGTTVKNVFVTSGNICNTTHSMSVDSNDNVYFNTYAYDIYDTVHVCSIMCIHTVSGSYHRTTPYIQANYYLPSPS